MAVPAPVRRRRAPRRRFDPVALKPVLDRLYTAFDHPESAFDPIQVVRRYPDLHDREVVGFLAAGLAFGRVASIVASIETVCRLLGPSPARAIDAFDPRADGARLATFVHRWTRGTDLSAVLWILRQWRARYGSIEAAFAAGHDAAAEDVGPSLEQFAAAAREIDLRPIYGRVPASPGAYYFFSRPSGGGACKRLNLFLRWMVRRDGVDPGGWTQVPARQLVVPLDTHTIRVGRCLGLTARATPGWKMATDITAALRRMDPDDPVRYDFSLCHLSMMGACGYGTRRGDAQCPLRPHCRTRAAARR
ncbi:MAG: TIGR02757 family protein [Vicinamibacterales bacterium]